MVHRTQLDGDDDKQFHIGYECLALQRIMSWAARAADLWTRPVVHPPVGAGRPLRTAREVCHHGERALLHGLF